MAAAGESLFGFDGRSRLPRAEDEAIPPEPEPRERRSLELLYSGRRFALAHGRDHFAILRRGTPWWQAPLYGFPRGASAWEMAWTQFCTLEPHHTRSMVTRSKRLRVLGRATKEASTG